jgi:ectoine hydroxylase-related dioxygenase (phytanoyl-CoA dioxygenase family)
MDWSAQRDQFFNQGFLVVRDGLNSAQYESVHRMVSDIEEHAAVVLRQKTDLLVNDPDDMIMIREEKDPTILCRVEDFIPRYPDFIAGALDPLKAQLERLLGEEVALFKEKINFKRPGGGAFAPHQDFPAYRMFPPLRHFTVMISIDPADLENGCLQAATNFTQVQAKWRNGYDGPANSWVIPYDGDLMKEEIKGDLAFEPLKMCGHDILVFDSFIPHYSEPNNSDHSRRAMFLTFNRKSEGTWRDEYYEMKRANPNDPRFHFATPTARERM